MEEIKYKHYIYSRSYTDAEIGRPDFVEILSADYQGLRPLVDYLNHAMSFTGNE